METRDVPDRHEVVLVPRFLSSAEHRALLGWATRELAEGRLNPNKAGAGRFFARYSDGDARLPDAVGAVKRRAIGCFGISSFEEEPRFRCFLGCNTEGGFVHPHVDEEPAGKHHLRINIMLSCPESGGVPIVDGRPLPVSETDLWCFHPAALQHGSTPVSGSRPRFVLSIGLLVPAVFDGALAQAEIAAYQTWERSSRHASAERRRFMPTRQAFELRDDDVPRRGDVRIAADGPRTIVVNAATGRRAVVDAERPAVERLIDAMDGATPARALPALTGRDALVGSAILLPDAVAALESRLALAEIVRFPQQSPYAVPRAYWENQIAVRARLPRLYEAVGESISFVAALSGLHRLATVGASGRNYYGAAGGMVTTPGELRTDDVLTKIDQPMLRALEAWAEQLGAVDRLRLSGMLEEDGRPALIRRQRGRVCVHAYGGGVPVSALLERARIALGSALDAAARHDRDAVIAEAAGFHAAVVTLHPFGNVNNSLAMNIVNDLLARAGVGPLPHLLLDHLALRMETGDYQQAFARIADQRDRELVRGASRATGLPLLHLLMLYASGFSAKV